MKKAVLIGGYLATGKTTYSKILQKKLNLPLFNKDTVKELLSDVFGFNNREENLLLSKGTFYMMKYCFKMIASTENDIIIESNFHQDEIIELNDLFEKYDYQVLYLVFKGDKEILYNRFKNRSENEYRHPCHLIGPTTHDLFIDYLNKNDLVNYNNSKEYIKIINIDATSFDYQTDQDLFNTIFEFFKMIQ